MRAAGHSRMRSLSSLISEGCPLLSSKRTTGLRTRYRLHTRGLGSRLNRERIEVAMTPTATYPHIEISPEGVAYVASTKTKVIEIALDRIAHHWDADEIRRQHPHLSLGQIYAALAYYFDHKEELDSRIDDQLRLVNDSRSSAGESLVRAKLKAKS